MQRKDYGVQTMARFALALNKPTGKQFDSGSLERKMVGRGLTREELDTILLHSETEEEAADRIEKAILGLELLPIDEAKASTRQGNVDTALVERMVTNRVEAAVDRVMAPVLAQIPTQVAEACKPYIDQMLGVVSLVKELVNGIPNSKSEPKGPTEPPAPEKSKDETDALRDRLTQIDGRSKEAREIRAKLAAAKVSAELA